MDQIKKSSTNNLTCNVCKIDFNSNADYALHEFSKKHCDNLIRLAKHRPVISKQKNKSESSQPQKEPPKVNTVTHAGSFAKYGYFIPGEIYASAETSKEFNTDYDPYLQKFAENPFKEKFPVTTSVESANFSSISSFNKKKKKKIKTCQVCNITLTTVPEYEAHMKSPQHIWKLKVTGMGVSAHFVKASTDLHTTDIIDESKSSIPTNNDQIPAGGTSNENQRSGSFPLLFCSDCELLLNSPQQYKAHISGKFHIECAQKKAECKARKEKFENPSPNQLYCYSCKISLNNLFQYNEHKNGKKHKTKCKNLVRKGITIPPEERVPGMPLPNANKPVIYPELYEKLVLENKKQESESGHFTAEEDLNTPGNFPASFNFPLENYIDSQESSGYSKFEKTKTACSVKPHNKTGGWNENALATVENCDSSKIPQIIFHNNYSKPLVDTPVLKDSNPVPEINNSQVDILNCQKISLCGGVKTSKNEIKNQITIIIDNKPVKCSICSENFQWQTQLDAHLGTESHLKKILELKMNKSSSENEILNTIFADRNVIKPNNLGKLTCSVCNVAADNEAEFEHHLNSIVHKYTLKDYRIKRTLEVKHLVGCNEQGLYFCKLCKEGWPSLLDYTQHLHFVRHKSLQRAQRAKAVLAKRRTFNLQKQRLTQCLKKKTSLLRRIKTEKNPGVRTKVCGVAVDLQSGTQAPIPNLEPLEPKIDLTKNVSIGVYEKANDNLNSFKNNNNNNNNANDNDNNTLKMTKLKSRCRIMRSNRKLQNPAPVQINNGPYPNNIPPFRPSGNLLPPLLPGPPFQAGFSRPGYVPFNRNWVPYSSPYPPVFEPYCGRSPMSNSYVRPPWFQRPSWPRYR